MVRPRSGSRRADGSWLAAGLLFAAQYPAGIFDAVLGMDRWAVRVGAYVALMTDVYPPFRLDQGGAEPDSTLAPPDPVDGSGAAVAPDPLPAGRL